RTLSAILPVGPRTQPPCPPARSPGSHAAPWRCETADTALQRHAVASTARPLGAFPRRLGVSTIFVFHPCLTEPPRHHAKHHSDRGEKAPEPRSRRAQ